ncbi:MAG: Cof-type HAD-IIB family hydrolase [Atopobiaceae bacterium]
MSNYRMLALDMDGTLLDSHKRVRPTTAEALEQLAQSGTAVALSTGRGLSELADYMPDLPFVRYGSLISGSLTMDFGQHQALVTHPIPQNVVLGLLDLAREANAMVQILTPQSSVTRQEDIDHMADVHMGIYQDMYERTCTRTTDFYDFVRQHPNDALKVNLHHHTVQERERSLAQLQAHPIDGVELTLARSEVSTLECTLGGVSKASGLQEISNRLGFSMEQVVCVGDAANDEEALRASGCAVAMGNATPEVKKIADLVVSDNDHDGIVDAIRQLF